MVNSRDHKTIPAHSLGLLDLGCQRQTHLGIGAFASLEFGASAFSSKLQGGFDLEVYGLFLARRARFPQPP